MLFVLNPLFRVMCVNCVCVCVCELMCVCCVPFVYVVVFLFLYFSASQEQEKRVTFVPRDGPVDVSPLDLTGTTGDLEEALKEQQWNYHVAQRTARREREEESEEEGEGEDDLVEDIEDELEDSAGHDYSPEKNTARRHYYSSSPASKAPTPSKAHQYTNYNGPLLSQEQENESRDQTFYDRHHSAHKLNSYGLDQDLREPLHSSRSQVGERTKKLRNLYGSPEPKNITRSNSFGSRSQSATRKGRNRVNRNNVGTSSIGTVGRGTKSIRSQSATTRKRNVSNNRNRQDEEEHFQRGLPSWIAR